jgi:hypothetical protein
MTVIQKVYTVSLSDSNKILPDFNSQTNVYSSPLINWGGYVTNKFVVIKCLTTNKSIYSAYHEHLGKSQKITISYNDTAPTKVNLSNGDCFQISFETPVQNNEMSYLITLFDADDMFILLDTVDTLKNKVDTLSKTMEEIYYAPGMPGFVKAQNDFLKQMNNSDDTMDIVLSNLRDSIL